MFSPATGAEAPHASQFLQRRRTHVDAIIDSGRRFLNFSRTHRLEEGDYIELEGDTASQDAVEVDEIRKLEDSMFEEPWFRCWLVLVALLLYSIIAMLAILLPEGIPI